MNEDQQTEITAAAPEAPATELDLPVWSVIGFDSCIAAGLTYDAALKEIAEQKKNRVSGLCIVTDDASGRINKPRGNER